MLWTKLVVWLLFVINSAAAVDHEIGPGREGGWGGWGSWSYCPNGHFVNSFQVLAEGDQGGGDDTAMNAIQLRCSDGTHLYSSQSGWGGWSGWYNCPANYWLAGFAISVEGSLGGGDDTAANQINFLCRNEWGQEWTSGNLGCCGWGSWSSWQLCQSLHLVRGFVTKVEGGQGGGDDTALNAVKMLCAEKWDPCHGCGHGSCIYSTAKCSCQQGWTGTHCDSHPNPTANSVSVSPGTVLELSTLTCSYTFSGYQVTEGATTVKWTFSSGATYTGTRGYTSLSPSVDIVKAGDWVECTVTPKDSMGATGSAVTSSRVYIGGYTKLNPGFPVGFAGLINGNNKYLVWKANEVTFDTAVARCGEMGGSLAHISDPSANTNFATFLTNNNIDQALIGLWAPSGTYVWHDGKNDTWRPFPFPSTPAAPPNHCIALEAATAEWKSASCTSLSKAICVVPHVAGDVTLTSLVIRADFDTADRAKGICTGIYTGNLATIRTQEAQDQLRSKLSSSFPECSRGTWIGLRKATTSAPFTWDSGLSSWGTYWGSGQPRTENLCTDTTFTSGWRTSPCTEARCFACDAPVALLSPTTSTLQVARPDNNSNKLVSRFSLVLKSTTSSVTTTRTLNSAPFTVLDLEPGASYNVQLVDSKNFLPASENMTIKMHCDCYLNATNNGAPADFVVTQTLNKHLFSWTDVSACDNTWRMTKQQLPSTETVLLFALSHQDPKECSFGRKELSDAFHQLDGIEVGTVLTYCLTAEAGSAYASPPVCVSKAVFWIGTLTTTLTTPNGEILPNVNVEWWAQAASTTVRGTGITDAGGRFVIEINTDKLVAGPQLIAIRPTRTTFGIKHSFELSTCMENSNASSCFGGSRDYGLVTLAHLVPAAVTVIDKTVFVVSGVVRFAGSGDFTDGKGDCPTPNATVCVTQQGAGANAEAWCSTTNEAGEYVVSVPLFSNVTVRASYTTGSTNHSITPSFIDLHMDRNIDRQNFGVTTKNQLTIQVGGGHCLLRTGTPVLSIWAREDPLRCPYKQMVNISSGSSITVDVPPMNVRTLLERYGFGTVVSGLDEVDILEYFGDNKEQYGFLKDNANATITYEYHNHPRVEFYAIGQIPKCNDMFVVKGSPDTRSVNITIRAWEEYGSSGNCHVSGEVSFWDGLIDTETADLCNGCYDQCLNTSVSGCAMLLTPSSDKSESFVVTTTVPGVPNIFPDYTRPVRARIEKENRLPADITENVLVEGKYTFANLFSDEIALSMPTMMIFDPPGDQSSAFIEKGTTLGSSIEVSVTRGEGGGEDFELLFGTGSEKKACFGFGASFCFNVMKGKALYGAMVNSERVVGRKTTWSIDYTTTTTTRISTSSYEGIPAPYSDLVVVSAFALRKSRSIQISALRNDSLGTCEVESREKFTWFPEVRGYAVRTMYDINNIDIPNIINSIAVERSNPPEDAGNATAVAVWEDRIALLESGLGMWRNISAYHDKVLNVADSPSVKRLDQYNKALCDPDSNYDFEIPSDLPENSGDFSQNYCDSAKNNSLAFDTIFFTGGGTTYELTTQMQSSQSRGEGDFSEWKTQFGFHEKIELGITDFFLMEMELKAFGVVKESYDDMYTARQETSTTVGFSLGDNNLGDKFNVQIFANTDFGTPVFHTLNGISVCPYEASTVQREKISIEVFPPYLDNIPPDQPAVFRLLVTNQGETAEAWMYTLLADELSNPDGLSLRLNGQPFIRRDIVLPYGATNFTLEVRRGPVEYEYRDVAIMALSGCEWDMSNGNGLARAPIGSTAKLSVRYMQPCAKVEWAGDLALADLDTYFVINSKPLEESLRDKLVVRVRNPYFPTLPWNGNPRLKGVRVEYRAPGSNTYSPAVIDSNFTEARLEETAFGTASVVVDVSGWQIEGLYSIRVKSDCVTVVGVSDEGMNRYYTPARVGRVDRTPPDLFGQFAEPADGSYWPGDEISLTFIEELNCFLDTYSFDAGLTVTDDNGDTTVYTRKYLDIFCQDNVIRFAFGRILPFSQIVNKQATIWVRRVQDLAFNSNPTEILRWTFKVEDVDMGLVSVQVNGLTLQNTQIKNFDKDDADTSKRNLQQSTNNTNERKTEQFKQQFCLDLAVITGVAPTRCDVTEVHETASAIEVSFQILPKEKKDDPSAAEAYETLVNLVEGNTQSVPPTTVFKSANSTYMTYSVSTTQQQADQNDESSDDDYFWDDGSFVSYAVLTNIAFFLVGAVLLVAILIKFRSKLFKSTNTTDSKPVEAQL